MKKIPKKNLIAEQQNGKSSSIIYYKVLMILKYKEEHENPEREKDKVHKWQSTKDGVRKAHKHIKCPASKTRFKALNHYFKLSN